MIEALPDDLRPLVLQHWAAGVIQVHLVRWHRYRHVRRRSWARLRARMPRGVHATLVRYANIRREWYLEPGSWLMQPDEVLADIVAEVSSGVWGSGLSPRVSSLNQNSGRT